VPTVFRGNP